MRKGFVLTLEASLAVLTAIIMSVVVGNMLSVSSINYFDKQQAASLGNDILSVLEQGGTFNNYIVKSESDVNSDLQQKLQLLPQHYCANVTVRVFDIKTEVFEKTYTTKNCEEGKEITIVKRIFSDYTKEKFGIAEMKVWLK